MDRSGTWNKAMSSQAGNQMLAISWHIWLQGDIIRTPVGIVHAWECMLIAAVNSGISPKTPQNSGKFPDTLKNSRILIVTQKNSGQLPDTLKNSRILIVTHKNSGKFPDTQKNSSTLKLTHKNSDILQTAQKNTSGQNFRPKKIAWAPLSTIPRSTAPGI